MPEWVILAEIVRSRGNRGEVVVQDLTTGPARFLELGSIFLLDDSSAVRGERTIEDAWDHLGTTILKFEGIDSIDDADGLKGLRVAIPAERRRPLPEGEFFLGDLIGCEVRDDAAGRVYGSVAAVHEQAGGVGLIELENGMLIPLAKAICVGIHPESRTIEVRLPEGLDAL